MSVHFLLHIFLWKLKITQYCLALTFLALEYVCMEILTNVQFWANIKKSSLPFNINVLLYNLFLFFCCENETYSKN